MPSLPDDGSFAAAAKRAGIRVVALTSPGAHHVAAHLLADVWQTPGDAVPVSPSMLRAAAHVGAYVTGVLPDDAGSDDLEAMVGASFGFHGADGHLHSHITGVLASHHGRGVGRALKLHQRAWVIAHGGDLITWTFDPLVRRNAWFNLQRLGVRPRSYLTDFYGTMDDGVNTGSATDRIMVDWHVTSDQVEAVLAGTAAEPNTDELVAAGAQVVVAETPDGPEVRPMEHSSTRLVAVPADIERLRHDDPDLARAWRLAVRDAMVAAMDHGHRVVGMTRQGHYVLAHP